MNIEPLRLAVPDRRNERLENRATRAENLAAVASQNGNEKASDALSEVAEHEKNKATRLEGREERRGDRIDQRRSDVAVDPNPLPYGNVYVVA